MAIGDVKGKKNGIPRSTGQRFRCRPLGEDSISMMVDMGFPRSRVEEALKNVATNSVELVMECLFSNLKELGQECDEIPNILPYHWVNMGFPKTMSMKKEEMFVMQRSL